MALNGSFVRPRRLIIFLLVLVSTLWFFGPSLDLAGHFDNASQYFNVKQEPIKVEEIHGLLYLVTRKGEQHSLKSVDGLDPNQPIDFATYAGGDTSVNWEEEVRRMRKQFPVVVFSKTYCPYSQRAKALLGFYILNPPPKIIEVDKRDDERIIKAILTRLTNHSTFPNILLNGKLLGGSDDLSELHASNSLVKVLKQAGVKVTGRVH